jgi:dTDP-4-dehydrorhamnose reductase
MRAIVIGASGLIGKALVAEFRKKNIKTIGTRNANSADKDLIVLDIRSERILNKIPDISERDTIYLLSAYSNPSWIFENQAQARELNYTGTLALISDVLPRRPRIVFMSSVEVFDGTKGRYVESDATNPLNYYGWMKAQIESELRDKYEKSTVVRTGWNVGWDHTSRCVVSLTYDTLSAPNARMARDNEFSIVDVQDTASCLAALIHDPTLRAIHICSDKIVNRVWLANRIIEKSVSRCFKEFREVNFSEIIYSEKRGRTNDLVNDLSKRRLGMKYRSVEDIIDKKVALLDRRLTMQYG